MPDIHPPLSRSVSHNPPGSEGVKPAQEQFEI
jgi:hypothetical protein